MRGLFFVFVLILVGIAGLGFYQGWFNLSSDNADRKTNVTFTVDKDKIQKDEEKAKDKIHDLGAKAKEKTGDRTDKAKEQERQP